MASHVNSRLSVYDMYNIKNSQLAIVTTIIYVITIAQQLLLQKAIEIARVHVLTSYYKKLNFTVYQYHNSTARARRRDSPLVTAIGNHSLPT